MKRLLSVGITLLLVMALATVNAQSKTGVQKPPPPSNNVKPERGNNLVPVLDTQRVMILVSDTSMITVMDSVTKKEISRQYDPGVFWIFGYVVREKRNTGDGVANAESKRCVDQSGKPIPCYQDYWQAIGLLDSRRRPLPGSVVVWQMSLINTK